MDNLGCKYVNKQGPKKGQACGASCRDDYCHRHKPKALETKKRYYQKVKERIKQRYKTRKNVTKTPQSTPNQPDNIDEIIAEEVEKYKAKNVGGVTRDGVVKSQPQPKPPAANAGAVLQHAQPKPQPKQQPVKKPWIKIF